MSLVLLRIATQESPWFRLSLRDFEDKVSKLTRFEVIEIKSPNLPRKFKEKKIEQEAELISKRLKTTDRLIVCDEEGKSVTSLQFSKRVESWTERTSSRTVIIVGGAFGLHQELKARATETLCLSSMVMNHEVACLVLLEQLYRAMTILKGVPYHNE